MRAWGVGILVCLSLGAFATPAGEKTAIPGTLLSLGIEVKIERQGDALKDLDEESRSLLKGADEFSFQTENGVYGSVMSYRPKDEFTDIIGEWCDEMASGLIDAVKTEGKLTRHDSVKFGSRRGHLFTLEVDGCTTEFGLIGGKDEIILIAVSAETKKCDELGKVISGLDYGGEKASERKSIAVGEAR